MTRPTRLHIERLDVRCLPSFSPATSYNVGASPSAVVTADFNNDGQLDLATTNRNAGTVSLLLGDGQGRFGAASHFAAGSNPRSLVVSDFDNDGKLDLATLSDLFMTLARVLPGNGDGTFRTPVDIPIHGGGLALAAGDFNADGRSDLVYTFADSINWDNPAVAVLLADGLGGFTHLLAVELNGALSPVGLAVGDLNADGKPDAVTANDDAGSVSVLLGNGDGMLSYSATSSDFTTGPSPRAVAVGAFTGDGIYDLITAGQTVDILPGLGGGRFGPPIRSAANGTRLTAVATADFDADGKLDAVVTNGDTGAVSALLGNGDGALTFAGAFATGTSPAAVTVGDFNRDGHPDVAVANADSNAVSVLLNDGTWPVTGSSFAINDVSVVEGNTGTWAATFTVTLSAASGQPVTVQFATANGTATASSDYLATAGTLTFAPGETSKAVTVVVICDRLGEPNETFVVNLSSPTNAIIADSQGVGHIADDEPRINIGDVAMAEGRKGQTTLFTFTVTLTVAYDQPVTMSFRTVNGTAKAGEDYVARIGTLTFAPGETTKTITIEVKGDSKREVNETFYLDLFGNSGNAMFTKSRGTGTILNDD